jgi:hypothetical protein
VGATATAVHVVHASHCPEIGPICEFRLEPPQLHDQRFYIAELRPILEYSVLDGLSVEAQLPLRVSATTIVYRRLDGTPFELDYPNIHHRNEVLTGPGDPWLSVRGSGRWAGFALSGRLGVTLPLGRTEPNPFELGAQGLEHQHVQLGTGTFTPMIGLEAAQAIGQVQVRGYGAAQLSLYENGHGYRAGNRVRGGVEVGLMIGEKLQLALGAAVSNEEPERWNGVIQQEGNLGRTDLLAGASVAYAFGAFTLSLDVKVPLYQHLVQVGTEAGQLSYPAVVNLGLQRTFDLAVR